MRMTRFLAAAVLVVAEASAVCAVELQSGIPVGGSVPKYKATKVGGGDDGVRLDASLCYT